MEIIAAKATLDLIPFDGEVIQQKENKKDLGYYCYFFVDYRPFLYESWQWRDESAQQQNQQTEGRENH